MTNGGNTAFERWILGIVALAVVSGIIGGVGVYARLAAIETQVKDLKDDFIEYKRDQHERDQRERYNPTK